jgi:hypothetical protein
MRAVSDIFEFYGEPRGGAATNTFCANILRPFMNFNPEKLI